MPRLTPRRPRTMADLRLALLLAGLAACGGGSADEPAPAAPKAPSAAAGARSTAPASAADVVGLRVVLLASEDGAPLAGLPVYVWPRRGAAAPRAMLASSSAGPGEIPLTAPDGGATFRLPPGRYSAAAEWPAHEPLLVDLKAGAPLEVELRRPSLPDQDCVLRVVSADDGTALAASEVALVNLPPALAARGAGELVRPDGAGRHALRVPSWSPVVAVVRAEGRGESRLALGQGGADIAPGAEREVRLERAAAVRGRLVDAAGVPVPDAVVAARAEAWELFPDGREPDAGRREEVVWTAHTDAGGGFALAGLPAGVALTLDAVRSESSAGGRRPHPLEPLRLEPGEERAAEVVLAAGTRLEGVLLGADGQPRAGVAIWLVRGGVRRVFTPYETVREHALTDAAGRFAFDGVEPGSWRVGPAAQGADADGDAVLAPVPEVVDVWDGMPRAELVLRPPGVLRVEGHCVGSRGEPVAGVHLVADSADQAATAISDADGAFALGPFVEGALELRTTAPSLGYTTGAAQAVRAGDRDVVVRVERAGALHGTIVRATSGVPLGADVELALRERLRGPGSRRVTAGEDGEFAAQDLEPGGYVVVARGDRGLVGVNGDVVVAPGATLEVALRMVEGARARFQVPADSGASTFVVLLNGVPVERGALAGREELETRDFPPGDLAIELHGPAGRVARQEATAVAGSVIQLDFRP